MNPIAFVENRTSGVVKVQSVDWDKLSTRLSQCKVGEKDGSAWLPADIEVGPRTQERVKSVSFLVLDVEADAKTIEGVKTVIGPEPPVPDAMVAELGLWGWRCILHTSFSHTAEHPRYRLTFALSRPLKPDEVKPIGLHVALLLGIGDCIDTGCLEAARLFYLPRVPADRKDLFQHAETQGETLPVDALLDDARKIEAAQKSALATRRAGQSASVIQAFNDAHDVGFILEQHGYQQRGRRRWLWSGSTTGLPGVRLLPDSTPERVYSSHGGDPLNDGHAHDAFDLWRILNHGGDAKAAVKAAARLMGMEGRRGDYSGAVGMNYQAQGNASPAVDSAPLMQPLPLPKLPPVPELSMKLLPDALQAWAADASDRARYRPDFFAVAAMTALGSVLGRKIGIRMKSQDDWTEYANVWGAIVGDPSALKSPAQRDAMSPFKALQVAVDLEHSKEMQEYEVRQEVYKLKRDAKKKNAVKELAKDAGAAVDLSNESTPEEPICRTYWTSDANDASLSEILAVNQNGLLIERDELSALLSSLEDEKQATLRGLLLSGWSGKEGFRSDRIIRGKTFIPKYSLSVFGGIQPGPLTRYVRGAFSGERADGLLQRFQLITWPDAQSFEYVDRWPDKNAKEAARELFARADTFDPVALGSTDTFGNDPPFLRFAPDAQVMFADWYSQFMQSQRGAESGAVSPPLAAHFGKYPGLVGKLALILHIADDGQSKQVSARTLTKALAWIQYLTPHAERVYHATHSPETGAAELLLARIRRNALSEKFKAWEITRNGWHGLSDREAVKKACRLLLEFGWLIEVDPGGAGAIGRPADPVYAVSPLVGA